MNDLVGSNLYGVDRVLADELRAKRTHIADALLDRAISRAELTVGCELLALAFVDRFTAAMANRDWPAFYEWIDRTCDRRADSGVTSRLLTIGSSMMVTHVDDATLDVTAVRAEFGAIAAHVERLVGRPRAAHPSGATQALDEIDAKLDRLISRLTHFDAATAEHSRAVSMWCARIGKKLALSSADTIFVMRAGLIHDIGKVTTPPQILNAPHRLSDPDMEIMRRHAEAGAAIVGEISQLRHLTPIVRAHHERIDGRGYPDRRAGSDIPLVARIVSVADSFNAMIGNRPYRLPMAPTIAIEQLKLHSGTQFDENVVGAMIDVVHRQR